MQLGMIGLGRMGADMVRRLTKGGQQCIAYDVQPAAVDKLKQDGVRARRRWKTWSRNSKSRARCG